MTWFLSVVDTERTVPFLFFALYMITSVRVCSYSAWCQAGSPNPFLPTRLKKVAHGYEIRRRFAMA